VRPHLALDSETLAANARRWAHHSRVPVRAVVKCDGYGWGYRPLVAALDDVVAGYCVADADELRSVRRYTSHPVVVLGGVAPDRLAEVLEAGGLPTVANALELEIAMRWARSRGRPLRLRVGLLPAAGWTGSTIAAVAEFAPALAASGAEVELWTHVTDAASAAELFGLFAEAERLLRGSGVRVVGTDLASTYPAAASGSGGGQNVRIGVGLFGAGSDRVAGLACALRVVAPVVRIERLAAGTRLGYGEATLSDDEEVVAARCGYGDGLPQAVAGADDILSVGMQYLTARAARCDKNRTQVVVLDGKSKLDAFAARAGRLTHEIVTAFGNAARANNVTTEG
jgi:alanine racemase